MWNDILENVILYNAWKTTYIYTYSSTGNHLSVFTVIIKV